MKHGFTVLLCVLLIFCLSVHVQGEEFDFNAQMETDKLMAALPEEARNILRSSGITPEKTELSSFEKLLETSGAELRNSLAFPFKRLLSLVSVVLLIRMCAEFSTESLRFAFRLAGIAASAAVLIPPLLGLIQKTNDTVETVGHFLFAAIPVYVALLTAMGHAAVGSTYGTLTLTAANGILAVCSELILPLTRIYLAFACMASITKLNMKRLPETLYKTLKWLMTAAVSLFTGILSIQTLIAGQTGAVTGKAVKMLASGMVPIVGGAFSDAIAIMGASISAVKAGAGAFGLMASMVLILPICVQIVSWMAVCEAAKFTAEIFDSDGLGTFFGSCSALTKLLLAVVFSVCAVSVISAAVLLLVRGAYG